MQCTIRQRRDLTVCSESRSVGAQSVRARWNTPTGKHVFRTSVQSCLCAVNKRSCSSVFLCLQCCGKHSTIPFNYSGLIVSVITILSI